ncbi:MAG: hypothetical protein L7W43_15540 [Rubripirellula sp.]|nr:hypothetical protein [Rhodopirellula sp.]MCH1441076.1 hypothetical protein [Rubripirellula sp.]OUX06333.1 MAG: hypothetical protein CBE00_07915 [Planctomycetaceae bacterium TMED240]
MKNSISFLVCAFSLTNFLTSYADERPNQPAGIRYLVLDNRIIERTQNAILTPGTITKHPSNPLFVEDKPWEKRFDNLYGNVIFDSEQQIYRCWYSPFIVDHSSRGMSRTQRDGRPYRPPPKREMAICYAISKDGITWKKPSLGLVDYEGNKNNNIILRGPHGAGISKDSQEADPSRRYKMIMQGLSTSYSPDGINWSEPAKINGIGKIAGDTHNNVFWNPNAGKYVAITRTWGTRGRQVTRLESDDFTDWQNTGVVLEATEKSHQPYAMPVFYHAGVFLGLVAVHAQPPIDRVWTELAWSPDSKQWNRISPGTPLIPCSEEVLDYDYGCVYACATPVFLPNQIRLYYGGSDYNHYGWRSGNLSLATLRPDGFAGFEQKSPETPATIVTKSIPLSSTTLRLNADVKTNGTLKVTATDLNDHPISRPITIRKNVTDESLELPMTEGKHAEIKNIKLRFDLQNAKLYSFGFAR